MKSAKRFKMNENDIKDQEKVLIKHQIVQLIIADENIKKLSVFNPNHFTRDCILSYPVIINFLLDFSKASYNMRIDVKEEYLETNGGKVTASAITRSRAKFNHVVFEEMFMALIMDEYSGRYKHKKKYKKYVFGIDGSKFHVPKTDETIETFGTVGDKDSTEAGIVITYDLLNHYPIYASITKGGFDERKELIKHAEFIREKLPHIADESIIIGDAGFPSTEVFTKLTQLKIDFLMNCSSRFLTPVNNAPMGSSLITLKNGIILRVIKFVNSKNEVKTLITNMLDMPQREVIILYKLRWEVETLFRVMKRQLFIEEFSGKTVNSILQDFWANMVLLSLAFTYKEKSNLIINSKRKGKGHKHKYKANTNTIIQTLRNHFITSVINNDTEKAHLYIKKIMIKIIKDVSVKRPGRKANRTKLKPNRPNYQNKR